MVSNRSASAEWQLSPTTSTLRATHTAEHHALRPAILPRNDSRGEGGGRQNRRRQGSKTGILYLRAGGLASGSNNGRSQQASASVVLGLGLCCPSIAKPSSTDMFKPRPRKKHLPLGARDAANNHRNAVMGCSTDKNNQNNDRHGCGRTREVGHGPRASSGSQPYETSTV